MDSRRQPRGTQSLPGAGHHERLCGWLPHQATPGSDLVSWSLQAGALTNESRTAGGRRYAKDESAARDCIIVCLFPVVRQGTHTFPGELVAERVKFLFKSHLPGNANYSEDLCSRPAPIWPLPRSPGGGAALTHEVCPASPPHSDWLMFPSLLNTAFTCWVCLAPSLPPASCYKKVITEIKRK